MPISLYVDEKGNNQMIFKKIGKRYEKTFYQRARASGK